jgi:hypothetical protein
VEVWKRIDGVFPAVLAVVFVLVPAALADVVHASYVCCGLVWKTCLVWLPSSSHSLGQGGSSQMALVCWGKVKKLYPRKSVSAKNFQTPDFLKSII